MDELPVLLRSRLYVPILSLEFCLDAIDEKEACNLQGQMNHITDTSTAVEHRMRPASQA